MSMLVAAAYAVYAGWGVPLTAYLYLASPAESTLKKCLKSRSTWVRGAAAHQLGQIRPKAKSAIPDLLLAMNDASPEVAGTSAWAVGMINSESPSSESIVALAKQVNHPNELVRRYSAYGLGLCGRALYETDPSLFESELIPVLVGKLDDPYMSNGAAQALQTIGGIAVPAVKKLTSSSDPRLKKLATNAVISLK